MKKFLLYRQDSLEPLVRLSVRVSALINLGHGFLLCLQLLQVLKHLVLSNKFKTQWNQTFQQVPQIEDQI